MHISKNHCSGNLVYFGKGVSYYESISNNLLVIAKPWHQYYRAMVRMKLSGHVLVEVKADTLQESLELLQEQVDFNNPSRPWEFLAPNVEVMLEDIKTVVYKSPETGNRVVVELYQGVVQEYWEYLPSGCVVHGWIDNEGDFMADMRIGSLVVKTSTGKGMNEALFSLCGGEESLVFSLVPGSKVRFYDWKDVGSIS